MCSTRPFAKPAQRRQAGFTLVELMIGVVIGLLASLAVTQVLVTSEGQKRATTSASDAQINGALALTALQRGILPAGYGFAAAPDLIGCPLSARFNGVPVPGFPARLVPVQITDAADNLPDTIRVISSGKASYSIPLRVIAPGYDPANAMGNQRFAVASVRGVEGPQVDASGTQISRGDLMVAALSSTVPCEMFRVTANPVGAFVPKADDVGGWNAVGFPITAHGAGSLLVNMGEPVDNTYTITNNALTVTSLRIAANSTPSYEGPVELYPNIVNLQAMYGKDSDFDGSVDVWNTTAPTNNSEWRQVIAVRLALVARSTQFEKEDVTAANPLWDVGTAVNVADTVNCGASKCLRLRVDMLPDWQRYRYRVFDTIIPLRNMLWNS
jgi:type IV pilus assembly protein PilW